MTDLLKYSGMRLGLVFFILVFTGCRTNESKWVKNISSGSALGTTYNITYLATSELNFEREIDSLFQVLNQSMSTYIPTSDISRINAGDSTIVVDRMFREVFELSGKVYEATDGYFDPTVGVLVNAWGFGPGTELEMDSIKVDSLLDYVGFNKVAINSDNRIKKADPAIYFDFNAIAKGYAVDRLAVLLRNKGITDFLIEVGGELVAQGENRLKEKKWVVAIDDPMMEESRTYKRTLFMKDIAMASSGNYRKFKIDPETGNRYVHTIDPITGYTKNSNILATSVMAQDCATADAFATSFMAMDLEKTKTILAQHAALEGYIIYLDPEGNVMEYMTNGFKENVIE
ncbi:MULTISPECIES: FAD:protein FMN transferase [unclassified Arenibacter]|uniref:FAD:protein FMN transferase n=1 Tax=unclassified Arenibacter TaxID=2615047 RepID=UPI000E344096|nr:MULTISPECIES: FAD:protein FMN transferase [unclassified Arenibacter]MCM4164194.1 FAD:protein FMN transferase [Arenibacter sp. A80]RFT55990.1 FAD:protein FMN transferase [Arenibacter sp. P308M17]